jgi:retron-type reverse transcriptase
MSHTARMIQRFLAQQAREQPARPLPNLLRHVTDWAVLDAAWRQVRRSNGADTPGADQVIARGLRADPKSARAWLQDLADALQTGTYRPGPVRRFEIAKPNQPGKTRQLAILTLNDRVVHMALKFVLEPIVESRLGRGLASTPYLGHTFDIFLSFLYGFPFQPHRSGSQGADPHARETGWHSCFPGRQRAWHP